MGARVVDWSPKCPPLGRAVAALGVFDGVHVGHQTLVRDAVALARDRDALAVVLTFDRDPDRVVSPERAAPQLLALPDKLDFLGSLGPDAIVVVRFDHELAEMSPHDFLDAVFCCALEPVQAVVGYDFRFGKAAAGDVDTLTHYGRESGFGVLAHELVEAEGATVTSSRIRGLVTSGEVSAAARLLGRPHRVRGTVVAGRGEGGKLGIPTANIHVPTYAAVPSAGVYAGAVHEGAQKYPAGISVGPPPTYPDTVPPGEDPTHLVESHLLGFAGDLVGTEIIVEFAERLRDQRAYATPEELTEAVQADLDKIAGIGR